MKLRKPPNHTAILLLQRGTARLIPYEESDTRLTVPAEAMGGTEHAYIPETQARFWAEKPIPRGWITVFVQGDPEPVTTREPRGYGAPLLARLIGDFYANLFAPTKNSGFVRVDWKKFAFLAGGLLLVAGGAWYYMTGGF